MSNDKLQRLLAKAANQGLKELDLSYQGLSTLPSEIGRLVHLESLDLSGNELIAVPPEMGGLTPQLTGRFASRNWESAVFIHLGPAAEPSYQLNV